MDTIIRIIIKIFQEIFEKDSARRQQEAARRAEILRQWQQNRQAAQARNSPQEAPRRGQAPARAGQGGGAQKAPQNFLERMDAILNELNAPQSRPAPRPKPAAPKPPPPPPKVIPKMKRIPLQTSVGKKPGKKFKLPGRTPLEQMIYAKVILDPCKALEEEGSRF